MTGDGYSLELAHRVWPTLYVQSQHAPEMAFQDPSPICQPLLNNIEEQIIHQQNNSNSMTL
jgi:hypothetical protein